MKIMKMRKKTKNRTKNKKIRNVFQWKYKINNEYNGESLNYSEDKLFSVKGRKSSLPCKLEKRIFYNGHIF